MQHVLVKTDVILTPPVLKSTLRGRKANTHPMTKHEMAVPRNAKVMMEPRFLKKCLWRKGRGEDIKE